MTTPGAIPQPTILHDTAEACEVLLIRHARSADVVPGAQGANDPDLHPIGVEQVAALARRLTNKQLAAVWSSNLTRTIRTARGLARPRGLEVWIDNNLREVELGAWSLGEFRRLASIPDPGWVEWSRTGRWDGVPGSEGDDALKRRITTAVDAIAARYVGASVAIVAHAGAINAYIAAILGSQRSIVATIENTSITTVLITPHSRTLLTVNDCNHLYDPVLGR